MLESKEMTMTIIGWYPIKGSMTRRTPKKHLIINGRPACGARGNNLHIVAPDSEWLEYYHRKGITCSKCKDKISEGGAPGE